MFLEESDFSSTVHWELNEKQQENSWDNTYAGQHADIYTKVSQQNIIKCCGGGCDVNVTFFCVAIKRNE